MSDDKDRTRPKPETNPASLPGAPAKSGNIDAPSLKTTRQDAVSADSEVADFLANMKTRAPALQPGQSVGAGVKPCGRLIFAMDATMSRQPTWDMALAMQADMFDAVRQIGGLDVQLVYFRGFRECRSSKWVSDPAALARLMTTVRCAGGLTQIEKVLLHARRETETSPVNALVFVGDAMEEDIDALSHRAGELALLGVPAFVFQEGDNREAESAFREIARLTKGAFCRFDRGSAAHLKALLSAVAVFAAGGRQALENFSRSHGGRGAQLLIEQMK